VDKGPAAGRRLKTVPIDGNGHRDPPMCLQQSATGLFSRRRFLVVGQPNVLDFCWPSRLRTTRCGAGHNLLCEKITFRNSKFPFASHLVLMGMFVPIEDQR